IAKTQRIDGTVEVPVVGAERAPSLVAFLEQHGAEIVEAPDDPSAAVRDGELPFAVIIDEDYPENWRALRPATVELVFDASRNRDASRRRQVAGWMEAWNQEITQARLLVRGIDPGITRPVALQHVDVASARARGIHILGSLPMFFLLAAFVCAMNVAIDTTAGERERGSLEALLAHAVSTRALAIGKWMTAVIFDAIGLIAMLVVSMAVLRPERFEGLGVPVTFGLDEALGVLVVVLPLTFMAPALQMTVAVFSKSFKEAQTYLSLLIFVPMMPGFLLMVEAFEVASWMHSVPVLAQQVQILDLLRGDGVTSGHFFAGALATLAVGFVLVILVGHLLGREKIVLAR
ncbi:MAG: ABC transporter permease, partial [Acidobacteriota bacterium]